MLSESEENEAKERAKRRKRFIVPELGRDTELPVTGHYTFPVPEEMLAEFLDNQRQIDERKVESRAPRSEQEVVTLDPTHVKAAMAQHQFRTSELERKKVANEDFNRYVELKGGLPKSLLWLRS